MALLGKSNNDVKLDENSEGVEDDQNLWLHILSQVQDSSQNKLPSCKALLVLGDEESGKTSLIAKLQGKVDPRKGSGLEYHCIYVRDEYRDDIELTIQTPFKDTYPAEDHTTLGVWVLDGDSFHRNLLKFALNKETLPHTTVILTAAMTEPWNIIESLQNWALILEEHIDRLRLPEEILQEHKNRVLKRFQEYLEPGAEISNVTSPIRPPGTEKDPLNNQQIKINLGLDIIVVITKTDYMSVLEKEHDYKEEHFDFIQLTIRNFCLLYGASLFYVSVKEDKNSDLLLKYLMNRVYSFPFRTPALVVEKDAVFIPAGWDNSKKNGILVDNLTTIKASDTYDEVIVRPSGARKPFQREAEVIAEDDQAFLCKLHNLLNQQTPASAGRPVNAQETPVRTSPGVQKTADRRISGSPGVQASPKKIEGKAGTVGGEGVLQNFFNSLLNRRTGSPIGGPMSSVRTPGDKTARHDAVAELDKLAGRSKKPSAFSSSSDTSFGDDASDTPSMQS